MNKALKGILAFSLKNKYFIFFATALLVVYGFITFNHIVVTIKIKRYHLIFFKTQWLVTHVIQLVINDNCANDQHDRNRKLKHHEAFTKQRAPGR